MNNKIKKTQNVLITGVAGFIGFHVAKKLLKDNYQIYGIDNISSYYSKSLKLKRIKVLKKSKNFNFFKNNLLNLKDLIKNYKSKKINYIIHLAAQPGVQFSFIKPQLYIQNNINAFQTILEFSKLIRPKHLIYASSSSVYGNSKKFPLKEDGDTNYPISMYAITKKTNELMAYAHSFNLGIPTTGVRFFTVYGPFGRPDMSILKFIKAILSGRKIDLYNYGKNYRDFTYIDDVVSRLIKLTKNPPKFKILNKQLNLAPYRIVNLSEKKGINLLKLVSYLGRILNKNVKKNLLPPLSGDVVKTQGDNKKLLSIIKKTYSTSYYKGLEKTVKWYLSYKI
jgi:UDP-glucuronate 4-epimerase